MSTKEELIHNHKKPCPFIYHLESW